MSDKKYDGADLFWMVFWTFIVLGLTGGIMIPLGIGLWRWAL